MKKAISVLALGAALVQAQPALAQITGHQCIVEQNARQDHWLPEVLFIGYDPQKKRVIISDPIVLYFNDRQPIEGELDTDNTLRLTVTWRIEGKSGTGQFIRMAYRATIIKATGRLSISAKLLGHDGVFTGGGICDSQKLK